MYLELEKTKVTDIKTCISLLFKFRATVFSLAGFFLSMNQLFWNFQSLLISFFYPEQHHSNVTWD